MLRHDLYTQISLARCLGSKASVQKICALHKILLDCFIRGFYIGVVLQCSKTTAAAKRISVDAGQAQPSAVNKQS
jgi:hypothetical protein